MNRLFICILTAGGLAALLGCTGGTSDITDQSHFGPAIRVPLETFRIHMDRYPTEEEGLEILFEESATPDGKVVGPYLIDEEEFREEIDRLVYALTEAGGYTIYDPVSGESYRFERDDTRNGGNAPEEERSP